LILTAVLALLPLSAVSAQAGKRVALVMGNAAYVNNPLPNSRNDANAMAAALRTAGFSPVLLGVDLDYRGMSTLVDSFLGAAQGAEAAVVYYSGHGAQASDQGKEDNYLLPVDIEKKGAAVKENDVRFGGLRVGFLSSGLSDSKVKASIVILDACRSLTVLRENMSPKDGLSARPSPVGSAIFYATQPGDISLSGGEGGYSVFTGALLKRILEPEQDLQSLAMRVVKDVRTLTGGRQSPNLSFNLDDFFYFVSASPPNTRDKIPPVNTVLVKGGVFRMGSETGDSDEKPIHEVRVSDFYMSKYETTVAEFRQFVQDSGYKTTAEWEGGGYVGVNGQWTHKADASWKNPYFVQIDTQPVVLASWYDAVEYANWLSNKEGLRPAYTINGTNVSCDFTATGWRLPTEAEWEYAARGGQNSRGYTYAGGNDADAVAWYDGNSGGKTQAVGTKAANELGLYDLCGNAREWCWDWYGAYSSESQTDPTGAVSGTYRILRGGTWSSDEIYARVSNRYDFNPYSGTSYDGFRIVRPAVR